MAVIDFDMTQDEPVHFRVRAFGPSPVTPGRVLLSLDLLNHQSTGTNIEIEPQRTMPYIEAIEEAVDTQRIYWVDWSRPKQRPFPRPQNNALDDRVLQALQNRQIQPNQPEAEGQIPRG